MLCGFFSFLPYLICMDTKGLRFSDTTDGEGREGLSSLGLLRMLLGVRGATSGIVEEVDDMVARLRIQQLLVRCP